jgi:hypothetical protein
MGDVVTLDALLRRVSRLAEEQFGKFGGLLGPLWLFETPDQQRRVICTPMDIPDGMTRNEVKDKQAEFLRGHFKELGVFRYAHAAEVWIKETKDAAPPIGSLADDPNRQEVLWIDACDGRGTIYAYREIIRPAHGKPYLGKLGEIVRADNASGRFYGLLPSAVMQ